MGRVPSDIDITAPGFAAIYDELPLWSAPFGLAMLDHVPLQSGITILDVGGGTGFLSIELAERCGTNSTVIVVDPWAAALERLRSKIDYLGITNVRLVEGDASRIDLPNESIHLVVSNLGINNFENADAVLTECFRLLQPGGTLALTTNVTGHMQEFYDVFRATLEELGEHDRLSLFDEHVRHRGTVESVEAQLERAGFKISQTLCQTFKMRFADGSSFLRHHLIRIGFLPAWKRLVPAERLETCFALLEQRLNELARGPHGLGGLELTIPVVYLEASNPL